MMRFLLMFFYAVPEEKNKNSRGRVPKNLLINVLTPSTEETFDACRISVTSKRICIVGKERRAFIFVIALELFAGREGGKISKESQRERWKRKGRKKEEGKKREE